MFSTIALAADFDGKLLDASCYQEQLREKAPAAKSIASCAATDKSTTFALAVGSNVYMLDAAGNTQAKTALASRADRTAPGKAQPKEIMAMVQGTEEKGMIKVSALKVQ